MYFEIRKSKKKEKKKIQTLVAGPLGPTSKRPPLFPSRARPSSLLAPSRRQEAPNLSPSLSDTGPTFLSPPSLFSLFSPPLALPRARSPSRTQDRPRPAAIPRHRAARPRPPSTAPSSVSPASTDAQPPRCSPTAPRTTRHEDRAATPAPAATPAGRAPDRLPMEPDPTARNLDQADNAPSRSP
jgi:hypothetical protein